MRLLNYTLAYLSVALLIVIGIWAVIFYVNMLDEIYDSIDDGLDNSKELIIKKVQEDSTLIHKNEFLESNYAMHAIDAGRAILLRDVYLDSTLYMINEQDYEPVRILKTAFRAPDGKFYELMVVSSMVEEDDLIEDLFYALIWLYLFLLASVLIINNVLLKRIWKPFYETLDKLKNFKLGSQEELPVIKTNVSEFNVLHETVSTLLQRNIAIFNNQKQFIENASHELQTPLAISINKLELLAEKKSMTDDQLEDVSAVIHSLERLTRLNKTLLMLSRIENRQYPEQQDINFNILVQRLVRAYSDLSEFKSVRLSLFEEGHLQYTMNSELAESMVSNLLKNAIVHSRTDGKVEISVSPYRIVVSNSSDIPALDTTRIFGRFYKNSAAPSSTGLGLAIVKSVADYAGLQLSYQYDGRHSFIIHFTQNLPM